MAEPLRRLSFRWALLALAAGALTACDPGPGKAAFKAIDQAKKIEFQAKSYLVTTELFYWPAVPGLCALLIGALGSRSLLRREVTA